MDESRYSLIKSANDKLLPDKQFEFYIFESLLEFASRKNKENVSTVKIAAVYDSSGKVLKKYSKIDLKKRNKTYTSFITSTFSPSQAGKPLQLEDSNVWGGGKGEVVAHYDGILLYLRLIPNLT